MSSSFFQEKLEALYNSVDYTVGVFKREGIPYEMVGGMASFLHADGVRPESARLTPNVDFLIDPIHLPLLHASCSIAEHAGHPCLVGAVHPVHLVLAGRLFRPEHIEPFPKVEPVQQISKYWVAPVEKLLRMRLVSNRTIDRMQVRDLLDSGLIPEGMDELFPALLRERLVDIRATE